MKKLWQKILNVLAFMLDVKKVEVQQEQGEVIMESTTSFDEGLPSHEEQHKVNEPVATCNHKYGPARFVKGGGYEQVCKLCGYIKHVDKH